MPMPGAARSPDPAPAAPCACGRLRRATRALTQFYDDAMAGSGLLVTQFSLLRTLERTGPVSVTELAAATLTDRSALSRNLGPLAARGLVADVAATDGRTRVVALSARGRAALARALPLWQQAQQHVARRLGSERLRVLVETLADIEALHPAAAGPPPATTATRGTR